MLTAYFADKQPLSRVIRVDHKNLSRFVFTLFEFDHFRLDLATISRTHIVISYNAVCTR